MNGAYVTLGLLYGRKDFVKTLELTGRAGQDADCNAASASGAIVWDRCIASVKNGPLAFCAATVSPSATAARIPPE